MFTKSYKYYTALAIATMALSWTSCQKALEFLPEDRVNQANMYQTQADADAAVLGIYGQIASLGDTYIILNELRADLVDVTQHADPYLQQLSAHDVTADNPYIDPIKFYRIIVNCNDALKNFKIMEDQGKLGHQEYIERYSDILTVRTWLYLQLGIHFGNIPYITETIESVDEIPQLNEMPKLTFDQLIDRLVLDVQNIPYSEPYAYPTGSSLLFTTDGYNTRKTFISKAHVLGELYLWKGDYYQAAKSYKKLLSAEDEVSDLSMRYNGNKISNQSTTYVSYVRSQEPSSLNVSLTTGWRSMFALGSSSSLWNFEWNWFVPYHNNFAPGNPFVDLVSKEGGYKIKPSQKIIDLWNAQTNRSGIPFDARGRLSYRIADDGEPEITKLTDNVQGTLTPLNRGGQWNIFRAAGLHLRFSEAANRDGHGRVAYALINYGLMRTFYYGRFSGESNLLPQSFFELESQITHEGFGPDMVHYSESSPYYFDARDNQQVARGVWYRHGGLRNRATLPALDLPGITYATAIELGLGGNGQVMIGFDVDRELFEDKIIEEAALEMAFEGNRWSDLMRIARRRNDPAFLADKVYEKLLKANHPKAGEVRSKLMDPNNWYLPFKVN